MKAHNFTNTNIHTHTTNIHTHMRDAHTQEQVLRQELKRADKAFRHPDYQDLVAKLGKRCAR